MINFKFKAPNFDVFYSKFSGIIGIEIGVVLGGIYSMFSFWEIQLFALPVILVLLLSKYNNTITEISIDEEKQIFIIFINSFINKKKYILNFTDLKVNVRFKWLLNYYGDVIEIKNKNNIIAVIPIAGSEYNKSVKKHLINYFKDISNKSLISYSETENAKKSMAWFLK
ncbi:hypothetical protein LA303_00835 [Candidatus Sulfidibacterium hydrothermale]|uniref:hypothetical protein n=1 Tax=Candidatus Sulfidibacterium hydrothermale TaxID=2875962 RepID=UPI001F0B10BD|nr:hypothetical protein [Candidatus Sulfidibacterium hydrothermale]UBM62541.1 hypothetical protein LA303_00835 [Candidatus Sulfidibacterium hydrothermale]